ncbi:DUF4148 domain-containing protein [Paraburkholderia acidiphila]|uniref:DUF4148 domain-containing protein n=1 Tax=Paraburkholderia acidiphila TaxID=2571747 RepID=A0A7Z2J919_9BURK|nr:DUF4148 domain-containing protein [Paraburkholderia acidiphila]QGZ56287.1 DUF4148 domain-containing protein [Paraburkholderia acidiphila]
MKSLLKAVALTVALAAPLAAFAQADQGLTREQVREQLVEFQQTSRNQGAVAAQATAPVAQTDGSFGGVSSTSSAAGGRFVSEAARTGPQSVYFGGQ